MDDQSESHEPESAELEARGWDDLPLPAEELPFHDLIAPEPIEAAPPASARYLAFGAVLVGGLLGAMIGWGVGDLMGGRNGAGAGAVVGGLTGAIGVGLLANLTLRAMNEWRAVEHPEGAGEASDPGVEGTS